MSDKAEHSESERRNTARQRLADRLGFLLAKRALRLQRTPEGYYDKREGGSDSAKAT
jgi:hypothetical protein